MKSRLLERIRAELRGSLARLAQAATDAHAAATDSGSKAESKYDTRNLEASYLATGQARRVEELAESIRAFETTSFPDFATDDAIDAGALVQVVMRGEVAWFLLAPAAGGMEITDEGREVTLLTSESPLYRKLLGMRRGETLDSPPLEIVVVS